MSDEGKRNKRPEEELVPAPFTPLESARGRRGLTLRPSHVALGVLVLSAVLILGYLFAARAVVFHVEPEATELDVSGISFNIGNNYLLLPGEHEVSGEAPGYFPLRRRVIVGEGGTQEIEMVLEPRPGRLELASDLDDVEVVIDGRPAGTAPGVIDGIARGRHEVIFRKHRYFPRKEEVEIEGLGRTQTLRVTLEPAWGQMEFTSAPSGADVYVDGTLVGQTPLTTEVLETGSTVRLSAPGHQVWEEEVTVPAGTAGEHPTIELQVAEGILDIESVPAGASVTIDDRYGGVTPLSVPLSPLREHRVELFLEGYRKAVREVRVEPEERRRLAAELTPVIGRVVLTVDPGDAEVLVDGKESGQGGRTLSLPAREHRITVRKPGYQPRTVTVMPRPDQPQSLGIELLTREQAYWASRPARITSPVDSSLLLFRPAVTFSLGAPRREPGRRANEAERKVRLERPFYIGTHEVTNGEFRRWKAAHTSGAFRGHALDMDDQPVANVSWQDAARFCNWLSEREGLPLFYIMENGLVTGFDPAANGYRMPTEAEWAWLAKLDSEGRVEIFPWGSDRYPPEELTGNYADRSAAEILNFTLSAYDDGFAVAAPVGRFRANDRGLFDLSGNVAEWVNDYYDVRPNRGEPELDPLGPESGSRHVIRGASWALGSRSELRWSFREAGDAPRIDTGFRVARYVDEAGESR